MQFVLPTYCTYSDIICTLIKINPEDLCISGKDVNIFIYRPHEWCAFRLIQYIVADVQNWGYHALIFLFIFTTFWFFYLSVDTFPSSQRVNVCLPHQRILLSHWTTNSLHCHTSTWTSTSVFTLVWDLYFCLCPLYAEVPGTLPADTGISGSLL